MERSPGSHPRLHATRWRATLVAMAVTVAVGWGLRPPPAVAAPSPPRIHARAAVIIDQRSGYVLYARNADLRLPMASTTKIMTGLLVLRQVSDLDAVVTVRADATTVGEDEIWLVPGEQLTVNQLMEALLIQSANDAAIALADYVAGSEKAFVAEMNAEAARLGLTHTHYANCHGLDQAGHYTSALDLARLARVALRDPRFAAYVRVYHATIPWRHHPWPRELYSHNVLLRDYSWVYGVKTGQTDDAGYCLAAAGKLAGSRFIVTLLHEPTPELRESDAVKLFHYAASLYSSRQVATAGQPLAHARVPYHDEGLTLVVAQPLRTVVRSAAVVTTQVEAPTSVKLPVTKGQVLGTVVYRCDGAVVGRRALVAERGFAAAGWTTRAGYVLHQMKSWFVGTCRAIGSGVSKLV